MIEKLKVLMVEDDIQLNSTVKKFLEINDFNVTSSYDGNNAISLIDLNDYDIYLIDINLPNINGLDIVKYVRKKDISAPIIMMTASLEVENFIKAYDNGCSEYIKKPFHLKELDIRIKNLLKIKKSNILIISENIKYDFEHEELIIKGRIVKLRKKVNRLLQILLKNINHIVKTDDIIDYVWENEIRDSYPLRQLVFDLRKVLDNKKNYVVPVVGIGYKFEV